jgi:uncharacterized protein YjdB
MEVPMRPIQLAFLVAVATLAGCDDSGGPGAPSQETDISISPKAVDMRVGDIVVLRVSGASTDLLTVWSSDNTDVATVAPGGFVRGILAGRANITVQVGEQRASVPVNVRER